MAVDLGTDDENTSTSYESSEDDAIHLLECDQVSMELKEDKLGVTYTEDGEQGCTPVVKSRKRKNNCLNVSSDRDVD